MSDQRVTKVYIDLQYVLPAEDFSNEAITAMEEGNQEPLLEELQHLFGGLELDIYEPYLMTCHAAEWSND